MKLWDITEELAVEHPIDGPVTIWRDDAGELGVGAGDRAQQAAVASIVPVGDDARRRALLLTAPSETVHVNGYPPLSAVVLGDRDEIRVGGRTYSYAAWCPTAIEKFHSTSEDRPNCALCSVPLADGVPVQACPACGARYHAGREGDRPPLVPACDVEDDRCSSCDRLRSELVWTPGEARLDGAIDA